MKGPQRECVALAELKRGKPALCSTTELELERNHLVVLQSGGDELIGRIVASCLRPLFVHPEVRVLQASSVLTWQQLASRTAPELAEEVGRFLHKAGCAVTVQNVYDDPLGRYLLLVLSQPDGVPRQVLGGLSAQCRRAVVVMGVKPRPSEPAQVPPRQLMGLWPSAPRPGDEASLADAASALRAALATRSREVYLDVLARMGRTVSTPFGRGGLIKLNVLKDRANVLMPGGRMLSVPLSQVSASAGDT